MPYKNLREEILENPTRLAPGERLTAEKRCLNRCMFPDCGVSLTQKEAEEL